ncbi:ubiquinol-cytochrome C chaperone [Rhodobacterales bacterium]|nr:ubiquinol-cytochrome C chaperone [Rhodobacterales bacterium]
MLFGLFRSRPREEEHETYCEIVAQARQPAFYTDFLVPDTIDGRFDLIVAHAVIYFRRMRGEGKAASTFAQNVFDLFFSDMDASLREMGVSDTRVPKKVKQMGEAFYGRADAYIPPIDAGDSDALAEALDRNIYTEAPEQIAQKRLALYLLEAGRLLAEQPVDDLMKGRIAWPDPERFAKQPV